jgi:hypothetical protein
VLDELIELDGLMVSLLPEIDLLLDTVDVPLFRVMFEKALPWRMFSLNVTDMLAEVLTPVALFVG